MILTYFGHFRFQLAQMLQAGQICEALKWPIWLACNKWVLSEAWQEPG